MRFEVGTSNKRPLLMGVAFAGLALLLLGVRPAAAITFINSCPFPLDKPGETYILVSNLNCNGTALTITADNVRLLLNGRTLDGDGSGDGVFAENVSGIQILGPGTIRDFNDGIRFIDVSYSTVASLRLRDNTDDGIDTEESDNNRFLAIWSHDNGMEDDESGDGMEIENGSDGNLISGCWTFDNGGDGIEIEDSDRNRVVGCRTFRNGDDGIELDNEDSGADENIVQGNWSYDNDASGIELLGSSNDRNRIFGNRTNNNDEHGIQIEEGSIENIVFGNTSFGNTDEDMFDENPPFANTWFGNLFGTAGGAGAGGIF